MNEIHSPPPRLGPRPLPLHLAMEGWMLQMSFVGLTPWSDKSPLSAPLQRLRAEQQNQKELDPAKLIEALTRAAQARMEGFGTGLTAYHRHPFKRTRTAPAATWNKGAAALRDYGGNGGTPALFVPSLVNRAYILDLAEDRSLMTAAARAGLHAYLLDWGEPGPAERRFTVENYVNDVMIPALDHIKTTTGQAPRLIGYCMGGTLAMAPAMLRPELISGLALLAAPWDFHVDSAASRKLIETFGPMLDAMLTAFGAAPVDLLQMLFASLDPTLVGRKFRSFANLKPDSESAQRFVELEDWVNDGIELAGPVAREALFGWYGANTTMSRQWKIGGRAIDPRDVRTPTLAYIPSHDRIVPPGSALALAHAIPNADIRRLDLGHVGMMASSAAPKLLYQPLIDWLKRPK